MIIMRKIAFLFFTLITLLSSQAQDTTWIQTLNFDSITTRKGVWNFPDNSEEYRKILMYYTLKCDPATTADKYNCGEWDYLTYTNVFDHTGEMIQDDLTHPLYMVGDSAPANFNYTLNKIYNTYKKSESVTIIDAVNSEIIVEAGQSNRNYELENNLKQLQYIIPASSLTTKGLQSGNIQKLKLKVSQSGKELRDFCIKLKNSNANSLNDIDTENLIEVYKANTDFNTTGWQELIFTNNFNWDGSSNILVDLSYAVYPNEHIKTTLEASSDFSGIQQTKQFYIDFEGTNDVINCGNIEATNDATKFSFEAWVKIDSWTAWRSIFNKNKKLLLQTGPKEGELFPIIRNPDNSYGNSGVVIPLNTWTHVAMVFDGTGAENEDKLKLYINGQLKNLNYNGTLPKTTPDNNAPFLLNHLQNNNNDINLFDVRIWSSALTAGEISEWKDKKLENTHPKYLNIEAYYPLTEGQGFVTNDASGNEHHGHFIGVPEWKTLSNEIRAVTSTVDACPIIAFIQGDYTSHSEEQTIEENLLITPASILRYKIEANQAIVDEYIYGWPEGNYYTFDTDGSQISETAITTDQSFTNNTLEYLGVPYEKVDKYEIGRFITPYGIQLDLGEDGFTWIYDVTDYEPLLHGDVKLSAGNQQELIDLKFAMIKGTPTRNVVQIDRIWGERQSYKYGQLNSDEALAEQTMQLHADAKTAKVRTRLTGHGHATSTGEYPHCCEWWDNTHYLYVNGSIFDEWHIWLDNDCGLNPVYPQGGNWPGAREGWCPGDKVKEHDVEISEFVSPGGEINLDYGIDGVPDNNPGMQNGNYQVSMQLIQYGDANFNYDAEVYDVIKPSNYEYHARKNPLCTEPMVIIRNSGKETLTTLNIEYGVKNGEQKTFDWTGELKFMEYDTISLPVDGAGFWISGENEFTVSVNNPNGQADEYAANNSISTNYNLPDSYDNYIILEIKSRNSNSNYISYSVKDDAGNIIVEKESLSNTTYYRDTLRLDPGCYTYEIRDAYQRGLSDPMIQWGSGSHKIKTLSGQTIKTFQPWFGHSYNYVFSISDLVYVQEQNLEETIKVYPNPASDFMNIQLEQIKGDITIQLINLSGQVAMQKQTDAEQEQQQIDISRLSAGIYIVKIITSNSIITERIIIK